MITKKMTIMLSLFTIRQDFFFSGRGIHEKGIKIQHIFCSPALRCVQTAVGLLRGLVFSLSQTSFTLQVYMKIIGCQTAKIGNQK